MNGWKVTAIIFIIISIVELVLFVGLIKLGINIIEKETECQVNVCAGYDAFYYDGDICYCYEDNEITKEEYIRWNKKKV